MRARKSGSVRDAVEKSIAPTRRLRRGGQFAVPMDGLGAGQFTEQGWNRFTGSLPSYASVGALKVHRNGPERCPFW